jgi:hypothetical protein
VNTHEIPKTTTRKLRTIVLSLVVALVATVLFSCGSNDHNSSSSAPPLPNIAGAWEFIAISNDGSITGINVAIKEGQTLVNGVEVPDGQITATSTQVSFASLANISQNLDITAFGGNCLPITSLNGLGPGSVSALDAPFDFTFTENGNVFNVTGTLSGDGQSLLNGTYTPQSGNTCSDPGGTITGNVVSKLFGTYGGKMCALAGTSCGGSQDFTDTVTATANESSSNVLTLDVAVTAGTDAGTNLTLTGPVTGNAFSVSGTFQGQLLTFYGYFETVGSTPSLYLVNAGDAEQPMYVGTLDIQ